MSLAPAILTSRGRGRRPAGPSITAYERGVQLLSLAVIVSSTFMRAAIPIGIGDIYPAQAIALVLIPLALWRVQSVRGMLNAVLLGVVISALATVGSLAMPDPSERYRGILQIAINAFTMLVVLSLLTHLSRAALRQVVVFLCGLFFVAALTQAVLAPEWNARGTSTFGIARPVLFFSEEGYVGLFAAFLFCAALALRAHFAAVLAAVIVIICDNRGSYIVAISAFFLAIPWVHSRRALRNVVFAIPFVLGLLFLVSTLLDWSLPILNQGSGATRQRDTQAILLYNDYSLFPWGGHQLDVFDDSRDRQINDTMNVWVIDLIWKYGFGGIIVFITWMWAFLVSIPKRVAPVRVGAAYWVPIGALFGLVANLQLNNPAGYSWLWVMLGVLFAIMSTPTSAAQEEKQPT